MSKHQPLIAPHLLLSGIGSADRRSLCEILAFLRDETAMKQVGDLIVTRLQSAKALVSESSKPSTDRLTERLTASSDQLENCGLSTETLRLLLWIELRECYDLPPEITYSLRGAAEITTELGALMAQTYFKNADKGWLKHFPAWARRQFGRPRPPGSFSSMVEEHVLAQIKAVATEEEPLNGSDGQQLLDELCSTTHAVEAGKDKHSGREALLKALGTSGSVAGLAAAVEAAGFSAYILAAKASALIPLVGGKTLVSLLAVVTNPVLVIPAIAGGAWWAKSSSDKQLKTAYASVSGATLALIGLKNSDNGLENMLTAFRNAQEHLKGIADFDPRLTKVVDNYRSISSSLVAYQQKVAVRHATTIFNTAVDGASRAGKGLDRLVAGLLSEKREAAVLSAITVGDVIYHAASIDPLVVNAVDFASTSDIDHVLDFAEFVTALRERSGMSLAGAETRLKGYVAEETVMHRLIEDGHVVEKPGSASEPGYDLIVDGQPFQVKCLEDLSGIQSHFATYPDIPVFANAELEPSLKASDPEWADRVHFIEGFTNEDVTATTQASLDAGEGMLDVDVPIFVVTLAAARNVHGWWRGQIPAAELVWTTSTDVTGRGVFSIVGGFTGSALGLLMLGPAGAVIGGPSGAIFGAGRFSRVKSSLGKRVDTSARRAYYRTAELLILKCLEVLAYKLMKLSEIVSTLNQSAGSTYARYRLSDDMQFIMEQKAHLEHLVNRVKQERAGHKQILAACVKSGVHPAVFQAELLQLYVAHQRLERGLAMQIKRKSHQLIRGFASKGHTARGSRKDTSN